MPEFRCLSRKHTGLISRCLSRKHTGLISRCLSRKHAGLIRASPEKASCHISPFLHSLLTTSTDWTLPPSLARHHLELKNTHTKSLCVWPASISDGLWEDTTPTLFYCLCDQFYNLNNFLFAKSTIRNKNFLLKKKFYLQPSVNPNSLFIKLYLD